MADLLARFASRQSVGTGPDEHDPEVRFLRVAQNLRELAAHDPSGPFPAL
jgi:hypothetical protein